MSETQHTTWSGESADSPDQVLAALAHRHDLVTRAEIDKLKLAVQWAIMHPVDTIAVAATVAGTEGELAIAGPGAPLVAEFCVAELALVLAMSTDAGRTYLGDAIEIHYRLPRLWREVTAGRVAVWKARKIAAATKPLPMAGAAFVDTHLAPVAARCSFAQIERTLDDALRRYHPDEAERRRRDAADGRHLDVDLGRVTYDGTVRVEGELDLADALDLDTALTTGAQHLADLGCTESLNVRRSLAAGALARNELTLDLHTGAGGEKTTRLARRRELVIYVHLSDTAVGGAAGVAGVENTRSAVSVEQVKAWCTTAGAQVTIRPVIDLNENLHTDAYRPTPLMREQAILTNPTCVFPHCTRPARGADLDHLDEHAQGGPTESRNLAPACRGHHRYKTHGGWTVIRTGATSFTWTSPHGRTYDWDTTHTRHTR